MEPIATSPSSASPASAPEAHPASATISGKEAAARIIPGRFPPLDGLRGLAVLAVFLFHYGAGGTSSNPLLHGLGTVVKAGWAGVTLFFLLSGFLITGILWDSYGEQHWWRNFYVRRVLRIFPLYYGSLLLLLVVAALKGEFGAALHLIWIPALFLQNFPHLDILQHGSRSLDIDHYWSLAVEEQFYLLWPLLLFLVKNRKQAGWLCLSIFFVSLISRVLFAVLTSNHLEYPSLLLTRAGELSLGGWLAIAYRSQYWDRVQRALPPTGFFAGLIVLAVAWHDRSFQLQGAWQLTLGLAAMTVFLAAILARSLEPGFLQRMTSAAWMRWVGRISYGIYVFHLLFFDMYTSIASHLVDPGSRTMFMGVRWLVAAVGSVTIAWLSFRFYESPFLRLKRRFASHSS